MNTTTVKELKQRLLDLEKEYGNIDDLEVWAIPCGTSSLPIGGIHINKECNRDIIGISVPADFF